MKVTDPLRLTIYYNLLVLHFFFKPAGASESKHMNSENQGKNIRSLDDVQCVYEAKGKKVKVADSANLFLTKVKFE